MDPRSFLDRIAGRPPVPTPEVASALCDLDRLARDRPDLAGPASGLAGLLRVAFAAEGPPAVDGPDLAAMAGGWQAGVPAFRHHPPRIDEAGLVARARALAGALGGSNPAARALGSAIGGRRVDVGAWAREALAGRPGEVDRSSEAAGLDPSMVAMVLRLALLPPLARVSAALGPLRPEGAWDRGDCPHCGSRPLLAESRGLEQRIFLRCGLCAAAWPGERLRCPSCGESSPHALHHSFVEGEQARCRLAHCDSCRYDWKVVSTLTALSPPAMIVADLATIHLDVLAEGRRGDRPDPAG